MGVKVPTDDELAAMINTRLAGSGVTMPSIKEAWFFDLLAEYWLLDRAAAGVLRVERSTAANTSVEVFAGRAGFTGTILSYAGDVVDLSAYGDDTIYIWAYNNTGTLAIGTATDAAGWPATDHIKLAEVTIVDGDIAYDAILDRRPEAMLQSRGAMATATLPGTVRLQALIADLDALTDNSGGASGAGTIAAIDTTITDPGDTPADADTLRDDLVTNTLPSIAAILDLLANAIATLAESDNDIITKVNAMLAEQKNAGQMSAA